MNSRPSSVSNPKKPWFKKNASMQKGDKNKVQQIDFSLVGSQSIGISMPYALYDFRKKQIIKNNGGAWDDQNKLWVIPTQSLSQVTKLFKQEYPEIELNQIPELSHRALTQMRSSLQIKDQKGKTSQVLKYTQKEMKYNPEILLPFYDKLFSFQKESVKFGIQHYGRCLLGDEMGVGKTIQALALAYIYKDEWPLLVVCPSSLKYNWQEEILRWYKEVRQFEIQVLKKASNVAMKQKSKIVIVSYQICRRNIQLFQQFNTVIVDQAHYLKTLDSKRSQALVPFLKSRKRVFLLTGTPALAKPRQIFNLLSIIRPDVYYNFKEFGIRYCDPQRSPWSGTIQYNGSKHSSELYYMLKDRVMIRRLKKEVLKDLPPKMRQKIFIECDAKLTKQIAAALSSSSQILDKLESGDDMTSGGQGVFTSAYFLTAQAKVQGVKQYLKELVANDVKMIIFAHHRVMLDSLEEFMTKEKVEFIRIDGSTPPQQRQVKVNDFQEKAFVRVALLSITAAGVGLTLTASSTVVFAQFHWTPAVMFQAEDRAHRIGQPSCVNCHYLVGVGTLDDYIYRRLQQKFNSVSMVIDGERSKIDAETLGKGEIGNVSKAAEAIKKKIQESEKKQKDMHRLSNYFKKQLGTNKSQISEISSSNKNKLSQKLIDDLDSDSDSATDSEKDRKCLQQLIHRREAMSQRSERQRLPPEEPNDV